MGQDSGGRSTGSEWRETVYGLVRSDFADSRLADLCAPTTGIQTGPFGSQLHQKDYVPVGTPIITVEHLGENRILHDVVPRVSEQDRSRLSKYSLQKGDIVFSRVGSVDRRALVRAEEEGWLFSGRCLRIRPNPRKIDAEFLSYFFGTSSFKNHVRAIAVGATMPSLNTQLLSDVRVPHPKDIHEQRAIAHILGTLDDKIECNRRMNATLEDMARTLFKSWFIDFDPVHAKATLRNHTVNRSPFDWSVERARAYLDGMDSDIAALFPDSFVDSEVGKIPAGWEETTLDKIVLLNPETWTARNTPQTVVYVDLSNTKWGTIEKYETYEWKDAPSRARRVLRTGDTIVGTVRPGNGSYAFIGEDGLTGSTGFAVLRPKMPRDRALVWCYATASENIERLTHLADGAAYPAVRPQVVSATKVILPSEEIRGAFATICDPFLDQMEANKRASRTLAALRDTLLPKLISGEVRVGDPGRFSVIPAKAGI